VAYLAELHSGDLVVLLSVVLKIGRSSIVHRTYMRRVSDNALCSTLEATTVRFDLNGRRSVPIEDDLRAQAALLMVDD